ncbi:hypothetical protein FC41_GL001752 [Lactobacillus hominis DSM 23910 = CRBIP 24.179]|nr:hypothetical protein FC41_GL001752 [Lactobacillus hominis DSM 23910 = CRBIP 24.179]
MVKFVALCFNFFNCRIWIVIKLTAWFCSNYMRCKAWNFSIVSINFYSLVLCIWRVNYFSWLAWIYWSYCRYNWLISWNFRNWLIWRNLS